MPGTPFGLARVGGRASEAAPPARTSYEPVAMAVAIAARTHEVAPEVMRGCGNRSRTV